MKVSFYEKSLIKKQSYFRLDSVVCNNQELIDEEIIINYTKLV